MKKYLMTGVAALALCAGFTACSNDEDFSFNENEYVESQKALIEAKYQQAFVNAFGQPAKNHTWGFGQYAVTRALSDMEAGANKNRNLWAATDGNFKLLVPTPLTEGQRLRVQAYFQAHPNLTWEAPSMTNYFVQQVYKGNPETAGVNSAEQYPQGNGSMVLGSAHMDQLTIGANSTHVLDFNFGDNPNNAKDVLNNGEVTNSDNKHSDQITLMIGVQPTCVGFESSDGSIKRNDCMALAGAKEIDDWAKTQSPVIGEDVWYGKDQYGYDNKSWNRSFVGLDYEQKTFEECKAKDWSDGKGINPAYVKVNETQGNYIYLGKDANNNNIIISKDAYKAQYGEYLLDKNGDKIPYVTDQTNQICGTNVDFSGQDAYQPRMDCTSVGGGNNDQVLDMTAIQGKLDINAYPALNGGLLKWIKDIGGRDYVFSDWIVTLSPAQEFDVPEVKKVRVICEDLNATLGGYKGDFDFNDAVFDLYLNENNKVTEIELLWTGAQFNITVDGKEIHDKLGIDEGTFSTTVGSYKFVPSVGKGVWSPGEVPVKALRTYEETVNGEKKIMNADIDLEAVRGYAPGKILVKPTFQWCGEREAIDEKYPLFKDWVKDESVVWY